MKKLALLLSLLALGAVGLVACGGDDDDEATAASATETTDDGNPYDYDELAADPADNKSCGTAERRRLTVVEGDFSCREARRLMHRVAYNRLPYQWGCSGPEGATGGYEVCTNLPGASSRIAMKVGIGEAATEADPGNNNRLSAEELITRRGNEWAPLFAKGGYAPSPCRYMGQPACERMGCERVANDPIKNCTPVSTEFRESFADATVERVVVSEDHHHARATFSNGESVGFEGQRVDEGDISEGWGNWAFFITEKWIKNAARR